MEALRLLRTTASTIAATVRRIVMVDARAADPATVIRTLSETVLAPAPSEPWGRPSDDDDPRGAVCSLLLTVMRTVWASEAWGEARVRVVCLNFRLFSVRMGRATERDTHERAD
jgi:hypothetical protein